MEFLNTLGGAALAFLGGGIAVGCCCAGSGKGCGYVGEASTGLLAEDPSSFSKCLILQVIPGTQGLYGLVIWFFAMYTLGMFDGTMGAVTVMKGFSILCACIPMAIGGGISAAAQGKVAASTINLVAKSPDDWSKGIVLCVVVEFYAILSLLASIMMLLNVA